MIKILFLTQNLGGGGAERVLVNLVNNMDKTKYDITVATMFSDGVNKDFLSKDVKYFCKHAPSFHGVSQVMRFIPARLLYKYFVGNEKYDVVVAFMHGVSAKVISGCTLKNAKKISWLHCGDMEKTSMFRSFPTFKSAVKAYSSFDKVLGVAKSVSDAFSKKTGLYENVSYCYNVNDTNKIFKLAEETVELVYKAPLVCSVGRFTSEKGFSRLIKISNRLHNECIDHTLMLIGGGALEENIKAEAKELNENVIFTGFQNNPYKYLNKADVFVCSSFFEGLSTATTEAVVLGIPTISTNVSGAKEILGEHNEYGLVVGMEDEDLYQGLKEMLTNEELRNSYKEKAKIRGEFFNTENAVRETVKHFE